MRVAPSLILRSAALAAYTVFVIFVTLTPRMPGTGSVALIVNAVLAWFHARGLFLGVDYSVVEFTANIGMFVPLGVLTALVARRGWWWLALGTAFSIFIEIYQTLFLPGRFGEWRDVLSNSLGFLLGAAIVLLVTSERARAANRRRAED